jgi:hypothetical protein
MAANTATERTTCSLCYDCAPKQGRPVKLTDVYGWPICSLCESRLRNGLVHYRPSNGTEFYMFDERCCDCRFHDPMGEQDASVKACSYGILDKLLNGMMSERDSMCFWFDPADLTPTCPATCLRYERRMPNDGDGPAKLPAPDCPGQMMFAEMFTPHEASAKDRGLALTPAREGTEQ